MLAVENFTLHTDGTSRNGKKIVGHQIRLESEETLSLGSRNFTLHTDGNSRNGKKIVGHQIRLESEETLSLGSQNFTLHTDGTSRNGKKIVGHQIRLESEETLSLSSATVANEDSSTLLDVTVQLLQEIKDIYGADKSEEERGQIFQSLLSKLTSVMTESCSDEKI